MCVCLCFCMCAPVCAPVCICVFMSVHVCACVRARTRARAFTRLLECKNNPRIFLQDNIARTLCCLLLRILTEAKSRSELATCVFMADNLSCFRLIVKLKLCLNDHFSVLNWLILDLLTHVSNFSYP